MKGDLQSHAVQHELHREVLSISGDTVAQRRARGVILAVLVDEVPEHLVQHRGPDGADGVHGGHAVGVGVDVRVDRGARRVGVRTDAVCVVGDPAAHRVALAARVGGLQADGGGHEVTPALAHAAGLERVEAVGVGGSAGEAVGDWVGMLVSGYGLMVWKLKTYHRGCTRG